MLKKTLQEHLSNLHEKVGNSGMGSGLFHEGHKKNVDNNYIDYVDDSENKHVLNQSLNNHRS